MQKPVYNILIAAAILALGLIFRAKGELFLFGLCSGAFVTLLNSFLIYLNVKSIGSKINSVLRYMIELLFIRMPLLAVLIFIFVVKLKAGLLGFALGSALGFTYGMYTVARPGNFKLDQGNV